MCDVRRYKCQEEGCTASYARQFELTIHCRKHTGERPFVCDIDDCSRSYTKMDHLKRHKSMVHEKACEVMCKVEGCLIVFNNKYSLAKHYNRLHVANNEFPCTECSERFSRKRQLKQHLVSHRAVPLKCSLCNITFSTLHLYNNHNSKHKSYSCDCGEIFNRWSLFCKHRRISCTIKKIDHKCIICNKVFTTKTNLKQHALNVHLEESQAELYRCSYIGCKRAYKYKHNLTYHMAAFHEKVHEDRIKCTMPQCDVTLKTKKNLRQHLIKIHGDVTKKMKIRKPRHDKGKPKKCMASILTGIELPVKEQINIITKSNAQKAQPSKNCINSATLNSTSGSPLVGKIDENIGNNRKNGIYHNYKTNLDTCAKNFKVETFNETEEKLKQKFVSILAN